MGREEDFVRTMPLSCTTIGALACIPLLVSAGCESGTPARRSSRHATTTTAAESRSTRGAPMTVDGLEIATVRPNFSALARATTVPENNPLFHVTFDCAGKVTSVTLIESSGSPSVDTTVASAIHQWTATGKRLSELSPLDPNGGVTVPVRILLR